MDEVRITVGRRGDIVDHADQHPVVLHVGSLRQAVTDIDQGGHHRNTASSRPVALINSIAETSAATTSIAIPQASS